MKNKFLNLLVATILVGSMLVGCGGNETGTETGANNGSGTSTNTEANVNTEVNVDTEVETNSDDNTVKIDPNIEYTETVIAFLIANEADYDKSMVDGSDIPNATHEVEEYKVILKESVALYRKDKTIIGYAKPDTLMTFAQFSEEWGVVGSTDYSEIYHVLASDVVPIMEIVEGSDTEADNGETENDANVMSDRAKAFFDEVRKGIADVNEQVVEADSSSGMECLGTLAPAFDGEFGVRDVIVSITENGYSQYYIEYLKETDNYVEFKLYAK